jgi:peptide/nickel transport system substrate-binding protein
MARFLLALIAALTLLTATATAQYKAQDRVFVVALNHEPETTDPLLALNPPTTRPSFENVVEPLIGVDVKGNPMATLAPWTVLDDGKVLEFKLRPGVKFHSGDPLTAADVQFSHQRMMAKNFNYQRIMRNFDHLEVVDPMTVRFVFKQPTLGFIVARNLFIGSKNYYDKVGEAEFVAKPVGTGPYRFVAYKPGEYLDVEAFDGYWGTKPTLRKVRFRFVKDDTTRVSMLKAGEVDVIMLVPANSVEELKKAGLRIATADVHPTISVDFQLMNKKTPWADKRVRLAMAHAIDGDAIVKGLFAGIPKRFARLGPTETGYDPDLQPYSYDPALAKKLLAEAGYPNGFNLTLDYWAGTYAGMKETAEAVVLYWRAVGINATTNGLEVTQMTEKMRKSGKDPNAEWVQVAPTPTANYTDAAESLNIAFYAKSPLSRYDGGPEFNAWVEAANREFDAEKRAVFIKKAFRQIHDDVVTIPVWSTVAVYAMKPSVEFTPTQRNLALMYLKDVKAKQ